MAIGMILQDKCDNYGAEFCCNIYFILIKATLKDYAGLDGCGFVLVLEDGEVLEMGDFDEEPDFSFNDGMKVRISYEEMSNMASICMVGPKVNITCMEKIK